MDVFPSQSQPPEQCSYCGILAEQPHWLVWRIPGSRGGQFVRLPLCVACATDWCSPGPMKAVRGQAHSAQRTDKKKRA
jgi:hypothetical protein